jgi:hypothetical protein
LTIALPSMRCQAMDLIRIPSSAPRRPRADFAPLAFTRAWSREPTASTLVRPAHDFHCVFDMPPRFGQLELALCFKIDGVLGSFRDGFCAVRFQELSRIIVDFDFSHGATLLSLRATVSFSRTAEP